MGFDCLGRKGAVCVSVSVENGVRSESWAERGQMAEWAHRVSQLETFCSLPGNSRQACPSSALLLILLDFSVLVLSIFLHSFTPAAALPPIPILSSF